MQTAQLATHFYQCALTTASLGSEDQSRKYLHYVLVCDPEHVDAKVLLALMYIKRGQVTVGYELLQDAHRNREKMTKGIPLEQYLKRFYPLVSKDKQFRMCYQEAVTLFESDRWRDGMHVLQRGLKYAGDSDGWLLLALCCIKLNKLHKAQKAVTKAIRLNPEDLRALKYQNVISLEKEKKYHWIVKFLGRGSKGI